jgi:predicted ribosome quality control (RQC) complex YloA/Tae2 family protein
LQNDKLTFKTAKNYDMWFHTKGVPGSHTILVSDKREFTDLAISEAAIIAACNSSAKENTKVPVDYTLVKNVKKPSGALPGKVVYYTNNMIYVIADKTKITEKKSG